MLNARFAAIGRLLHVCVLRRARLPLRRRHVRPLCLAFLNVWANIQIVDGLFMEIKPRCSSTGS